MASLNVAFWNVQNLFEPGIVSRGPQTPAELDEKLAVLGDVINAFFGGDGPDVLGLAEVNTKRIFLELVRRLATAEEEGGTGSTDAASLPGLFSAIQRRHASMP